MANLTLQKAIHIFVAKQMSQKLKLMSDVTEDSVGAVRQNTRKPPDAPNHPECRFCGYNQPVTVQCNASQSGLEAVSYRTVSPFAMLLILSLTQKHITCKQKNKGWQSFGHAINLTSTCLQERDTQVTKVPAMHASGPTEVQFRCTVRDKEGSTHVHCRCTASSIHEDNTGCLDRVLYDLIT